MKFKDFLLLEKRRNANHPSQRIPRSILGFYRFLGTEEGQQIYGKQSSTNLYVTFVNVDMSQKGNITSNLPGKVGFNPSTKYDTPIGLYAYPIKKSIRFYGLRQSSYNKERKIIDFPFATDAKYWAIFKIKDNYRDKIIDTELISLEDAKTYVDKLLNHPTVKKFFESNPNIENELLEQYEKNPDDLADKLWSNHRHKNYYIKLLWSISRTIAILIRNKYKVNNINEFSKVRSGLGNLHISLWTKMLMDIGIAGVVDTAALRQSSAIVHSAEEVQAVIFDPRSIEVIKSSPNTDYNSEDKIKTPLSDKSKYHKFNNTWGKAIKDIGKNKLTHKGNSSAILRIPLLSGTIGIELYVFSAFISYELPNKDFGEKNSSSISVKITVIPEDSKYLKKIVDWLETILNNLIRIIKNKNYVNIEITGGKSMKHIKVVGNIIKNGTDVIEIDKKVNFIDL